MQHTYMITYATGERDDIPVALTMRHGIAHIAYSYDNNAVSHHTKNLLHNWQVWSDTTIYCQSLGWLIQGD